jgi:Ni/Co efflux regulator RcnB
MTVLSAAGKENFSMKRLLIAALAAGLAFTAPALADNRPHGGAGHPAMAHSAPRTHVARPAARFAVRRPAAAHRAMRTSSHRAAHRPVRSTVRHVARRTARHVTHGAVHDTRHVAAARHASGRFAKVRRSVRASHRFHAGVYHRPRGWFARHWRLGQRLPRGWFVRNYWITDWAIYGLWAPIDGLVWVRVGPDAMLIDPVTGEIVAVDYAIFF